MAQSHKWIRSLDQIGLEDLPIVGGKNASLGEMIRHLKNVRIPDGFVVTVDAYREFVKTNHLEQVIEKNLNGFYLSTDHEEIKLRSGRIREAFLKAQIPREIENEITIAYLEMKSGEKLPSVAVRSSATLEDLPTASFAGQQESYLNVSDPKELLLACRRCFASLFTERAVIYRNNLSLGHLKVGLSIGIQRMVRSDLASAGVMFTLDTESGFEDVVLINSAYGLGESVVQGLVNPDEILIFKPSLKANLKSILRRRIGSKETKIVYSSGPACLTQPINVDPHDCREMSLADQDALQLARWALAIEDHYSQKYGKKTPMDIEWAKDGETNDLYIVQARPETVKSQENPSLLSTYKIRNKGRLLLTGRSVGAKIGIGSVRIIRDIRDLGRLRRGEILVTEKTDPDWEPAMAKASAIITEQGGRTCHAAIVSRELGIPAVIGAEKAMTTLSDGMQVTVSCAEGDIGFVYDGRAEFDVQKMPLALTKRPKTKVMLNVANPSAAFHLSFLPNDGVGLARLEFIINNSVRIHPLALTRFDQLKHQEARKEIIRLTEGYPNKSDYFVDKLSEGIALIAAAFFPKPVILRFSDFKTNEYAHLLGGEEFEPTERNPMLGFRGASRYYNDKYRDGFALECKAIVRVRNEMGLKNLKLMIPFCRTVHEGQLVLTEMTKHGLFRGRDDLEVFVMCEIPSNVILAKDFSNIFDGFSIGSNDLTQLVLGVDRDSETVAHLFDERDPAVKDMIRSMIRTAKAHSKHIGICGQAPSDYPDFTEFLIREGIESISLTPDSILRATELITQAETGSSFSENNPPQKPFS